MSCSIRRKNSRDKEPSMFDYKSDECHNTEDYIGLSSLEKKQGKIRSFLIGNKVYHLICDKTGKYHCYTRNNLEQLYRLQVNALLVEPHNKDIPVREILTRREFTEQDRAFIEKIGRNNVKITTDEFLRAIKDNKMFFVKEYLKVGGNINAQNKNGITALMVASSNGQLGIVEFLVNNGAKIDDYKSKESGYTPLIFATEKGFIKIVKYLIDHGAKVDALSSQDKDTALIRAAKYGHLEIVKYLFEHDADINKPNIHSETALMYAAIGGHLEVVKYLIDRSADIDKQSIEGRTALLYASFDYPGKTPSFDYPGKKLEIFRILVNAGANLNLKDNRGQTVLMSAVDKNRKDIIDILLKSKKVNLNSQDERGETALILAIHPVKSNNDVIEKLIKNGADVNKQDKYGNTAFTRAIFYSPFNIIETLLKTKKVNLNIKNKDGESAVTMLDRIEWHDNKRGKEIIKLINKYK